MELISLSDLPPTYGVETVEKFENGYATYQSNCFSSASIARPALVTSSSCKANKPADNVQHIPFPMKLHAMLEDAENESFDHIISWCCNGKAFKVHDSKLLVEMILPRYFTQRRYKSFQRQINVYGFTRVAKGRQKGLCHHKHFVRDNPSLCSIMHRVKVKSDDGADLILMSQDSAMVKTRSVSVSSVSSECSEKSRDLEVETCNSVSFEGKTFFPVASLDDNFLLSDDETKAEKKDATIPSNHRDNSFPWKLYDMLENVESNGQNHIISWAKAGRGLRIHKPKEFVEHILPRFFSQTRKLESFQRQLNLYGYTRVKSGPMKGLYLHKYFVRGQRSLCRHITRPR